MKSTVNSRIREARKKKGYTQAQLAEFINMKCSTYSQMERQGSISVERALEIAKILDADEDYILLGKQKENLFDKDSISPTVLTANEPQSFLEQIKSGQDELILTHNEKNIIKNLRMLKPKDKAEIIKFIESKCK